jgi:signal peptidase II
MELRSRLLSLSTVTFLCVAVDQMSKAVAQSHLIEGDLQTYLGDTLRLQLAHNYGAFLSLGASLPPAFRQGLWSIGVGCVLLGILAYSLFGKSLDRPLFFSLALIFSGGISNLYDRIVHGGYVVDFLNVGIGPLRTGIFNVADMAITAGALIVLFNALRSGKSNPSHT